MKTLFFIFVFFVLSTFLAATIINVPGDQPTIQEGINVAVDADTVLVQPGTYVENINYNGKNITLASLFLTTQDTFFISQTIVEPNPGFYGVRIENNENTNAILIGFTIQNVHNTYPNPLAGVKCNNSSPTISNNIFLNNEIGINCHESNALIFDNKFLEYNGDGVSCVYSSDIIYRNLFRDNFNGMYVNNTNCIIVNNEICFNQCGIRSGLQNNDIVVNNTICFNIGVYGYGIECLGNPDIVNNIIWGNSVNLMHYGIGTPTLSYNCLEGGCPPFAIDLGGNIDEYPSFDSLGTHPFALLEDSPCIDAGIPDTTGLNLPPWDIIGNLRIWDGDGNGSAVIDMGAYEYGAPPYVDIEDNVIIQTSEVFLHQNYPNPFNPTTKISFSLQNNSNVELSIYNIKGQKVENLVNEVLSAGEHSIVWDGRDSNGNRVSSGIYLYRLQTGSQEQVRKMLLLK